MIHEKNNLKLKNWELVSVNPQEKNWNWKNLFCFWGVSIQSIVGFSIIASLYLVLQINIIIVFAATLLAGFLVAFFSNLVGSPSQKHGIPFAVFLRTSMGVVGAKYVAILRGLVAIFMFGVQTFFLSKSLGYLFRILIYLVNENFLDKNIFSVFYFGLNIIDWASFIFTIFFQIYLFRKNQGFNKVLINISAAVVYIGLILFCLIIASKSFSDVSNSFNEILFSKEFFLKSNILSFFSVFGTMFAYFSIVIVNFGDFSRYVKNESELKKGNFSLVLNIILFSIFSVFIVTGSDIILRQNFIDMERIFLSPTDIIGKFDNIYLSIIALVFIIFATASTNLIANFIPSQYSLINFAPSKLTPTKSGIIIGIFAFFIGSTWLPIISQIGVLSIVDTVSAFFGPVFGIMIVDYYLIKKKKIINQDLFSSASTGTYYFSKGWQIKAIYSLFIAFIFSASTIWNNDLRFLQTYSWIIGASIGFIMHYLLSEK